jgi:hemoglobin
MTNKSLYDRLGGYDAISAVSNDLVDRLQRDWDASGRIAARMA